MTVLADKKLRFPDIPGFAETRKYRHEPKALIETRYTPNSELGPDISSLFGVHRVTEALFSSQDAADQ
jgi:hypothetical protein